MKDNFYYKEQCQLRRAVTTFQLEISVTVAQELGWIDLDLLQEVSTGAIGGYGLDPLTGLS
jgi:hypothetical protein